MNPSYAAGAVIVFGCLAFMVAMVVYVIREVTRR